MGPTIEKQHIVATADSCGGRPRVTGTRIRVQDIYVWHELQGRSAAEIVRDFPQLTLADVYAALAYYYDHREAIQRQMREDEEFVRTMKEAQGPGLLDRIRGIGPDENSFPSR